MSAQLAKAPNTPDDRSQWPAVERAYDFVLPSYALMVNRYEAADARLTHIVTLLSGLIFGLPVLARSFAADGEAIASPLLVLSMAVLVMAAAVGIVARQRGRVRLVDPMVLFEKNLHFSEWDFRKNAIHDAGRHFDANATAIERKGRAAGVALVLMVVAVVVGAAALIA